VKVAIVAPLVSPIREPQQGGSQAFLAELARGLAGRGHKVHLYAASGSSIRGVEVIDTGIDHRELEVTLYRADGTGADSAAAAEAAFTRVYAMVGKNGYDVVHNHAFDAPAISAAADLSAPIVYTLHLPPERRVADALRRALRRKPPTAVACVSDAQANAWADAIVVDAILPPHIPTRRISFSPAPGSGAVFAGRLSSEKGAAEAIAIARIAEIPIDVFGDRYDERYARSRIDPLSTEPGVVVRHAVSQDELWTAMGSAAVVLCPAKWDEPFGMVAAEAQACGTPVVAFRRGALDQVIIDGVTGFLVAPDDLRAAATAVVDAPALSRHACRAHAENHLDIERSLEAHERLYEQLAGAAAGARTGG
jgi:glycosyltransferase involved in cell wall biosynthesis